MQLQVCSHFSVGPIPIGRMYAKRSLGRCKTMPGQLARLPRFVPKLLAQPILTRRSSCRWSFRHLRGAALPIRPSIPLWILEMDSTRSVFVTADRQEGFPEKNGDISQRDVVRDNHRRARADVKAQPVDLLLK